MELITKAEAAEVLGISVDTLEVLIRGGKIPYYKLSPHITRLAREDLHDYIQAARVEAKPSAGLPRRKREPYRGGVNNSGYYPGMKVV